MTDGDDWGVGLVEVILFCKAPEEGGKRPAPQG